MIDRRSFVTRIGLGTFLGSIIASTVGTLRYLFPQVFYEPAARVKIGKVEEFQPGSTRYLPDVRVFVRRERDGIAAISAVCPHLGCVIHQTADGFSCPCHGSVFTGDGDVIAGPSPRGLSWLKIAVSADGRLVLDRSRPVPKGNKFST